MATLDDIRRAVAANLHDVVLPANQGFVSPFFNENPKLPALQVVGVSDYELADNAGGLRYEIGIEGMLGRISDRASQERLDGWIQGGGMLLALDSSINPLTKRMLDNGTIAEEEDDAGTCNFVRFGGQARLARGGVDVLVATWFCEVFPPAELFT